MPTITLNPDTLTWLHKHMSLLHTEWLLEKRRIAKSESYADSAYAAVLETDIIEASNVLDALKSVSSTHLCGPDPAADSTAETVSMYVNDTLECGTCEATVPIDDSFACEGWTFEPSGEWLCPRCAMNAEVSAYDKQLLADLQEELNMKECK
jgi:hypothetical protein